MFRVDVQAFADQAAELVQITQNIRVSSATTEAANDSLLASIAGEWSKVVSANTSAFKNDISNLEHSLTRLTDEYLKAAEELNGSILPSYRNLLSAAGAGSIGGSLIAFDEKVNAKAEHDYLKAAERKLRNSIGDAEDSLIGLERSGAISSPLSALRSTLNNASSVSDSTMGAFEQYAKLVTEFEADYSASLDPSAFDTRSGAKKWSEGWIKSGKDVLKIGKHGFEIGNFFCSLTALLSNGSEKVEYLFPGRYVVSEAWKGFKRGFSGIGDTFKPSKWSEYWHQMTSGAAKNDAGLWDDIAGMTKAEKWANRFEGAGKLLGYAGNALAIFDIGTKSVDAYQKQEGDGFDKAGAATYEAVTGTSKFVLGKVAGGVGTKVGAAIGTLVGGPVGGLIGGAVGGIIGGVCFDKAWKWGTEKAESSGVKEGFISGFGNFFRNATKNVTRGSPGGGGGAW